MKIQPTRSVTQQEIETAFQKDLDALSAREGVLQIEGVLLFDDEFQRGPVFVLSPADDIPVGTHMEWDEFPPTPYKLVHHALMVLAERPDEDIKELKIELEDRMLWAFEGRNLIVCVETEWGSAVHKSMWTWIRKLDRHSDDIQKLTIEDALIQNVKEGKMECSHTPDGQDQFKLTPKGIKFVENMA